jgi:hypothetical protein
MKAPKCRLCGEEHWSNAPHSFGGVKVRELAKRQRVALKCRACAEKDARIAQLELLVSELEAALVVDEPRVVVDMKPVVDKVVDAGVVVDAKVVDVVVDRHGRHADLEKRRKRQREYARAKRARAA